MEKRKRENNHKRSKLKTIFLSAFLFTVFLEGFLWILEIHNLTEEPYHWGYRNHIAYKLNECKRLFSNPLHKNKIKVVAIGDSFGERGFFPYQFDKFFNNETISYNLCIGSTAVRFQSFYIQKVVIPKIKPNVIIWGLKIPNDFKDEARVNHKEQDNLNFPMSRYYRNDFEGTNFFEFCNLLALKMSRIYRYGYNFLPKDLQKLLWAKDEYHRGFIISYDEYDGENQSLEVEYPNTDFNMESGDLFKETIESIEENDIDFLVVSSPRYNVRRIYPPVDELFNKLSSKNFLDLNGCEYLNETYYFRDLFHLNTYGAKIYTNLICEKLQNHI